jgi:hypothetical protein
MVVHAPDGLLQDPALQNKHAGGAHLVSGPDVVSPFMLPQSPCNVPHITSAHEGCHAEQKQIAGQLKRAILEGISKQGVNGIEKGVPGHPALF